MNTFKKYEKPKRQLEITVVFGIAATRAYADGERDAAILRCLGRTHTFTFNSLEELNSFILGVEEATGYHDTLIIDD